MDPAQVVYANSAYYDGVMEQGLLQRNLDEQVEWLKKRKPQRAPAPTGGAQVKFTIILERSGSQKPQILKDTDESFSLKISGDDPIEVEIKADNYFGARHAIESAFQLMEYDDVRGQYVALTDVQIRDDAPAFKHRGISLDTSR